MHTSATVTSRYMGPHTPEEGVPVEAAPGDAGLGRLVLSAGKEADGCKPPIGGRLAPAEAGRGAEVGATTTSETYRAPNTRPT